MYSTPHRRIQNERKKERGRNRNECRKKTRAATRKREIEKRKRVEKKKTLFSFSSCSLCNTIHEEEIWRDECRNRSEIQALLEETIRKNPSFWCEKPPQGVECDRTSSPHLELESNWKLVFVRERIRSEGYRVTLQGLEEISMFP